MKGKDIWSLSQSLLVIFEFIDNNQLRDFRKALDNMLNASNVNRLVIIVNVPKEVDKSTLPPHFLIYYNSPNDYTFFGKMKDIQLESELQKNYDLLINFAIPNIKILDRLKTASIKKKVIVNAQDSFFDLSFTTAINEPDKMLNFVISTLEKINEYD
ncbi:MAG: hypothetical protein NT109_11260 [Flavobacteriia bacterium]|nr:hypothetical protein [Flavobacteriia bacterium]